MQKTKGNGGATSINMKIKIDREHYKIYKRPKNTPPGTKWLKQDFIDISKQTLLKFNIKTENNNVYLLGLRAKCKKLQSHYG